MSPYPMFPLILAAKSSETFTKLFCQLSAQHHTSGGEQLTAVLQYEHERTQKGEGFRPGLRGLLTRTYVG